MKRTALLLLVALCLTASAQRRRKPVEPVFDVTPEQAIAAVESELQSVTEPIESKY